MAITSFYGFKLNQTQTFDTQGKRVAISVIKTLPLEIKRVKTKAKDGYWAYQVIIKKKGKELLREIRLEEEPSLKPGQKINIQDVFQPNDRVKVTGITKGKGFAGVVKRWRFAGGPKTHGQSDRERAPGSIGMRTTPGRVWKGKKMAGHMGVKTKTITGLKIFKIDDKKNEVWVTGLLPGNKGGLIKIAKMKK